MKKILLLILVLSSIFLGYTFPDWRPFIKKEESTEPAVGVKKPILKVALVADSHNENELLAHALRQAQGLNADFVIGLGDYTNLGTVEELEGAKAVFDKSGLEYYVIPGDRDGWESRQQGGVDSFEEIFGQGTRVLDKVGIQFVLIDNSDIYKGIDSKSWSLLEKVAKVSNVSNVSKEDNETFDTSTLIFAFAHKTPFHPDSRHVMGEDSVQVAVQAKRFMDLMETTYPCHSVPFGLELRVERLDTESSDRIPHPFDETQGKQVRDDKCPAVDGFFSGDLHFFAQFKSPQQSVKITTIGAVASERNFQGPRFGILKVYDDWRWEVEDVEIR